MSASVVHLAIDEELLLVLIAALDSHRDVLLGNIHTAVSDEERRYFESAVDQVEDAMELLNEATEEA
ncbi:hypothetical protein [Microbacterium resistens]|uniref:hypothetical protein n=1 Tax=Microbacterium resistens TaxID=156977 RepID=UPI00082A1837|nr:hypothetical protein [Microbacterium resistens]